MRLQDITSSRPALLLAMACARLLPRRAGYALARGAARLIAWRRPEIYRTVRTNMQHVVGCGADDALLDQMAYNVFRYAGQGYYDFFRAVGQPHSALLQKVEPPSAFLEMIRSENAQGRGVLVVATHMSNFDLVGLVLSYEGLSAQLLSLADPGPAFRILNRLRATDGFEVTPIGPESLRMALRRLANGGVVVTGADRPMMEEREWVEFFGQPAELPLGPVRLALMTGATVIVGSCYYHEDGIYRVRADGPVEMVRTGRKRHDIMASARRLAAVLEEHVRAYPDQWLMFHRVWPDDSRCGAEPVQPQPSPEDQEP
ncbi:MAG: lysophospholipid acyltransferase family protein [Anaerolineales bacterium]|nr:lysophospholipid acyltransferase family protein [Anaerolineales bacterium]